MSRLTKEQRVEMLEEAIAFISRLEYFVPVTRALWVSYLQERIDNTWSKDELTPKVSIIFGRDVPGCVVQSRFSDGTAGTFYRLRLEADGAPVIFNVAGRLASLRRDGAELLQGDALRLTVTPAERVQPEVVDLYAGIPEFLDVLVTTDKGSVFIPTRFVPNSLDVATMFKEPGFYALTVAVMSPLTPMIEAEIVFRWTGDYKTSELSLKPEDNHD